MYRRSKELMLTQLKDYAMAVEFEGKPVETSDSGYLADIDSWNTGLAQILASGESIELTERHWDVINFLRGEYFENNQTQPNTRAIVKAMSAQWGEKISQKDLYMLFPGDPSKQGGKIAGLPESRRKGGY